MPLHAPSVNLDLPDANAIFYPAQLVVMQASAYDLEDGSLGDAAFQWSSDIDGNLGTGANFSTVDLSTGKHTLTLTVTDSDGMASTATRAIEVVDGSTPEATNLNVDPNGLGVVANMHGTAGTYLMTVRSSSSTEIDWTASDDASWLSLGAASGTTPSDLSLTVDPAGLAPGKYTATVTVQSAGAANSPASFTVNLEVQGMSTYLPLLSRGP